MHVVIGIPTMDGKIIAEVNQALLQEQIILGMAGHTMRPVYCIGCSLIAHARNDIVASFLASAGDVLVWIDADVAWEPGAILKMVQTGEDFIGGAYPHKKPVETYSVGWLTDTAERDNRGFVEVRTLPGGFLVTRRAVFERIAAAAPDRSYLWGEKPMYAYFETPFMNGALVGEDCFFCLSWRSVGGKVWLMPDLMLTHIGGANSYTGSVGDWLAGGPDIAQDDHSIAA